MRAAIVKKIASRCLLLLVLLFAVDRVLGWWLDQAFYKQKHGDDLVSIYAIDKTHDDILILGGSRASHHYVATEIEQLTGMTCFNGGRDNMDVIYASAIMNVISERYQPKVVILDFMPIDLADYAQGRVLNIQRTSTALLPFAHKYPELYPTIQLADRSEKLKASISHIYPYNSLLGSIVQNTYTHLGHESIKGYEPLYRRIDSNTYKDPMWGSEVIDYPLDAECVRRMKQLIQTARSHHIRLIGIMSPFYFPSDVYHTRGYLAMKNLLQSNGLECYDLSNAAPFHHNPWLYDDDMHMNDSGAILFSRRVAGIIRLGHDTAAVQSGR